MTETPLAGPITIRLHVLTPVREQFAFPEDVYDHWSLLAPLTGRLTFTLTPRDGEPGAGGPTTGECVAGDVVLCPPGVRLARHLPEPARFWFVEFDLGLPGGEPWWPSGHVRISDRRRVRADHDLLDAAEELREPRRSLMRAHALLDVLVLIGQESGPASRPVDPGAARGAALLEERLADPQVSVESIAAAVHLSRTQFTRRFSQAYGVPPIRYLTELRLARARQLLLETALPIAAIAEQCGYQSPFYFTRVFHSVTGEAPSAYRAARRI